METKDLLGYLGIEANDIESFKKAFHEKYPDENGIQEKFVKPAIGKLTNKLKQNILNKAREEGIDFTLSEFEDQKLEDAFSLISEKKIGKYKSELELLRSKAGQNGDDVVKEWQEKFEKASKRASEEEALRKQLAGEFDNFKSQAANQVKSVKVNYLKTDIMGKIKFKPGLKDLEKEGFNAFVEKNYRFDFDDQERPIVLDSTGNRIRSEKKADEWKSPEEVLTEAARKFDIYAENPQAGKPVGGMATPNMRPAAPPIIRTDGTTAGQTTGRKINPSMEKYL